MTLTDILHTMIDVHLGRRNLAAHEGDAMHEALTPGYTIPAPSATAVAEAQALLAHAQAVGAAQAALIADPTPVPAPAAEAAAPEVSAS